MSFWHLLHGENHFTFEVIEGLQSMILLVKFSAMPRSFVGTIRIILCFANRKYKFRPFGLRMWNLFFFILKIMLYLKIFCFKKIFLQNIISIILLYLYSLSPNVYLITIFNNDTLLLTYLQT